MLAFAQRRAWANVPRRERIAATDVASDAQVCRAIGLRGNAQAQETIAGQAAWR